MIAEAFAALWTLIHAALLWLMIAAVTVTVVVLTLAAGARWAWQAVRGAWGPAGGSEGGPGLPGALRAAPEPAETPAGRPGPSWARGDTDNLDEAA